MTATTARRPLVGWVALLALAGAIASCGGTVRDSLGDPEPNSGGAASMPTPGTGSRGGGGTVGIGGKAGGAGTIAVGGKAGGAGVFPICGPNEIAKTPPGGCCPTCYPLVSGDAGPSCDPAGYTMFRKELEQKYSSASCMLDADCVAATLNLCERPDCGIALPQGVYQSFESNLISYADAHCLGCAPTQDGMCPPGPPMALCRRGACLLLVRQ